MRKHFGGACLILAISSAAAIAANLVRARPLEWIRRPLAQAQPAPAPSQPSKVETAQPASNADQRTSPAPPADSSAAPTGSSVTADVVLDHLAKGTARFVDARETKDYSEGHLRGAIDVPSSAVYQNISTLFSAAGPPEAKPKLIVYCGGGECEASHNVADALQREFHYENVVIYTKGWEEVMKDARFKPFVVTGSEP